MLKMTSTILNHDYHAALLLNNIGVALLTEGYNRDALVALKDSLHAMKTVFRFHNEGSAEVETTFEVHQKLRKAKQRWMEHTGNSTSTDSCTDGITAESFYYEHCCIPQLSTEGCIPQLSTEESLQSCEVRATTISLPADSSHHSANGRDPDLETVVIICNLARSCYLVSETVLPTKRKLALQLLNQTFSVLDLAFDIISNRFALCEDDAEESRLLTVALLVTGTAKEIYRKTGHDTQAADMKDRYHRLQRSIKMQQSVAPSKFLVHACAAE